MRVFNISLSISSSFHSTARNRVTSPCTQSCCCWSKIPYLISHQSSGREAELELPPNWFNTNFLGFSLGAVASLVDLPSAKPAHCLFLPIMKRTLFYSTPSHVSFSQTASHFARRMKIICGCFMYHISAVSICMKWIRLRLPLSLWWWAIMQLRDVEQFNSNFPPRPHSSTPVLEKIWRGGTQCKWLF